MSTLVIGARGSIGRHVVNQLQAVGHPVRASVRDIRASADLPDGVPVVAADLTKPDTLQAALNGIQTVFVYAPTGDAFITAARNAGVEHVVLLSSGSVLLPDMANNAIATKHRKAEEALSNSGLNWTPIRPLALANNTLNWANSIQRERKVHLVHPDAVTAPVHERDVAAVAVAAITAITDAEHVSNMLTGSELLSQRQQVELIGADIRIIELSEAQARKHFTRFEDPQTVDAILEFIAAAKHGGSPATTTVKQVLGRHPLPFAQWVSDHAAEFSPRQPAE
jgi:uncharacterized protein YbjT (DUF2867 family)